MGMTCYAWSIHRHTMWKALAKTIFLVGKVNKCGGFLTVIKPGIIIFNIFIFNFCPISSLQSSRIYQNMEQETIFGTTRSWCPYACIIWAPSKPYGLNQMVAEGKQSWFTCFCKSNINQTFTNSGGTCMRLGAKIAIFAEIRHLMEGLITFLSIFWPRKSNRTFGS